MHRFHRGRRDRATPGREGEHVRRRPLPLPLLDAPGHGEPFTGHAEVIDRLVAFYEKRQASILELLADGPQTPAQLAPRVFPHAKPSQLYLTLSEVMGNLEVLEDRGRVRREERQGRIVFRPRVE